MPLEALPSSLSKALGSRVRGLRVALGLSQERLARKLGMDRGDLSRLEAGKANPTMARVAHLAAALGCEPSDLMRASAPRRPAA